ncbi:hypothetical protein ACH3XW_30075 [Acanthocheilonema viteae]
MKPHLIELPILPFSNIVYRRRICIKLLSSMAMIIASSLSIFFPIDQDEISNNNSKVIYKYSSIFDPTSGILLDSF